MSSSPSGPTPASPSLETEPLSSLRSSDLPERRDPSLPVRPVTLDLVDRQALLALARQGQPVSLATPDLPDLWALDRLVLGSLDPPVRLATLDLLAQVLPALPGRPGAPGRPDPSVSLVQAAARQARQELGELVLPATPEAPARSVLAFKASPGRRGRKV